MIDIMDEVNIDSAEVESVDIVSMISKERRDVYYAMKCSRVWKAKAKELWKEMRRAWSAVDSYERDFNSSEKECIQAEALAASRLELAKVVDRHRRDRMHSDMKLGWKMAKEILEQAKELGDE